MHVNRKPEPRVLAWVWRAIIGPAYLVDGIGLTLSAGTVSIGASLWVARRLAAARAAA